MSSQQNTVDFILDQITDTDTNHIRAKKMFGEYAIYYQEKVVALVCDDQLFIKPTAVGKAFIKNYIEKLLTPEPNPIYSFQGMLWKTVNG